MLRHDDDTHPATATLILSLSSGNPAQIKRHAGHRFKNTSPRHLLDMNRVFMSNSISALFVISPAHSTPAYPAASGPFHVVKSKTLLRGRTRNIKLRAPSHAQNSTLRQSKVAARDYPKHKPSVSGANIAAARAICPFNTRVKRSFISAEDLPMTIVRVISGSAIFILCATIE